MKKLFNLVFLLILAVTSVGSIIVANSITLENVIYIDPGHGGPDGGGVGLFGEYEKEIVLEISLKLKKYLNQAGYNVLLTRYGDYDLADNVTNEKREDILRRVKLINESNCLLYVSIHANKFSDPTIHGAQTFYKDGRSDNKELAEFIQEAMVSILQNTNRVAKPISGKYLIDNTVKPGALVEVGFLSNPIEAKLLRDEFYQEKVAYAIHVGITSYLEKNK